VINALANFVAWFDDFSMSRTYSNICISNSQAVEAKKVLTPTDGRSETVEILNFKVKIQVLHFGLVRS
jgi:hypothetical protein